MKTQSVKKVLYAALLIVCFGSFSSCNRGVGCPSNFSLDVADILGPIVQGMAQVLQTGIAQILF